MSHLIRRKKRLEHPQVPIPPPQVISPNKITSYKCLLSPTYIHTSENILKHFHVKLRYHKKLTFSEVPSQNTGRSTPKLLSIYKRMKYLRGLDITTIMVASSDKFYKIMRRLSSVKIHFENSYFGMQGDYISKIFRYLRRLDLASLKVKISCSIDYNQLNRILKSLIQGIKYMSNLKSFGLKIQEYSRVSGIYEHKIIHSPSEDFLKKAISSTFAKLRKIEKLSLVFNGSPNSTLRSFTERFDHFSNLKIIQVVGLQKQLLESIYEMKSLTSVTFYEDLEPNDIILLALKNPSLKNIRIKEKWYFSSKELPALKETRVQQNGILQLHIDLHMKVSSKNEYQFVADFLSAFRKVKSLRLCIECCGEDVASSHIAKQINKLTHLENLEIGLIVKSGAVLSQFFSLINNLTLLKATSLVLKTISKGWEPDTQEICEALKSFLLKSHSLKQIIIGWDKFSSKCAEGLARIMNVMHDLDSFQLAYRPLSKWHDKYHYKILNIIEKTFQRTNNRFREVIIASSCDPLDHKYNCFDQMNNVEKAITNNRKIKKVLTFVDPVSIPFYHDFFEGNE